MLLSFSFVLSVSSESFAVVSVGFVDVSVPVDVVSGGRVEDGVTSGGVVSGLCSSKGVEGGLVVVDGILGGDGRAAGLAVILESVEMGVIFGVEDGMGPATTPGWITLGAGAGM